jgi:hypothetical protein
MDEYKPHPFDEILLESYPDMGGYVGLSLSPPFVGSVPQQPYDVLECCAYALGRFVCHIQSFGNQYAARASKLKRQLDIKRAKAIGNLCDVKSKDTDKSKLARAYSENPELGQLEEELADMEERARHYEKMPDAFRELINIIKYELRRKEQDRELGRFNAPV